MHGDVTSKVPGDCPICGMTLVRAGTVVRDSALAEDALGDGAIAAAQLLASGVGGVAPNLVGYYPSPLRLHVVRYETYAPAWLETDSALAVLVYRDQLAALEPDESVTFSPGADPRRKMDAHFAPGDPAPWDRSLVVVRFALEAPATGVAAGTVGWVRFPARPRRIEVVPAGAVLEAREGPYVLVVSPARGTATKRPIEIGRIVTGLGSVLSGLEPRELVVSVNAFFWDAERRLEVERRSGSGEDRR